MTPARLSWRFFASLVVCIAVFVLLVDFLPGPLCGDALAEGRGSISRARDSVLRNMHKAPAPKQSLLERARDKTARMTQTAPKGAQGGPSRAGNSKPQPRQQRASAGRGNSAFVRDSGFLLTNENTPGATAMALPDLLPNAAKTQQAVGLMQEYAGVDESDPQIMVDAGWALVNDALDINEHVNTFFTMADSTYKGGIVSRILGAKVLQNVGVGISLAQIAVDLYNEDAEAAAVHAYKNTLLNTAGILGSRALQLSFVGVFAIDYALTQLGEASVAIRMDNNRAVYFAYNDSVRSIKDWEALARRHMGELAQRKRLGKLGQVMDAEIDRFSYVFWEALEKDAAGTMLESGGARRRMLALSPSERETLRKDCVLHLKQQMGPIFLKFARSARQKAEDDYITQLENVAKQLNRTILLSIVDTQASGDKPSAYAGYTARLAPLSAHADPADWTLTLDSAGSASLHMTFLGHVRCGMPNRIDLYRPGAVIGRDKPAQTLPLLMEFPRTTVALGGGAVGLLGTYKGTLFGGKRVNNVGKVSMSKNQPFTMHIRKKGDKYVLYIAENKDSTPYTLVEGKAETGGKTRWVGTWSTTTFYSTKFTYEYIWELTMQEEGGQITGSGTLTCMETQDAPSSKTGRPIHKRWQSYKRRIEMKKIQ